MRREENVTRAWGSSRSCGSQALSVVDLDSKPLRLKQQLIVNVMGWNGITYMYEMRGSVRWIRHG